LCTNPTLSSLRGAARALFKRTRLARAKGFRRWADHVAQAATTVDSVGCGGPKSIEPFLGPGGHGANLTPRKRLFFLLNLFVMVYANVFLLSKTRRENLEKIFVLI